MAECCANCRYNLTLRQMDYANLERGEKEMPGYVCTVFEKEGIAYWMIRTSPNAGQCEGWEPKKA